MVMFLLIVTTINITIKRIRVLLGTILWAIVLCTTGVSHFGNR